jgi:hypothetical protein
MVTSRSIAALLPAALVAFAPPGGAAELPAERPASSTYADCIVQYDPGYGGGCVPTNPNFMDASAALGAPDYSGGSDGTGAVSLGSGGVLELCFTGVQIDNSGDSRRDLRIIEIGGYSEEFFVELRPGAPTTAQDLIDLGLQDADQNGYFEVGRSSSASGGMDIDALLNRPVPEESLHFDAVRLRDDPVDTPTCATTTPGADIDAVEALHRVPVAAPSWGKLKSLYLE